MTDSALHKKLIAAAKKARGSAYAPYSKFKVGAALLADGGKIFAGCNVENASYGLTQCAERVAIAKAVSEGARRIRAIAVVAAEGAPISPCGACRQVIYEFGKEADVLLVSAEGKRVVEKITTLLPRGFSL